MKLRAIVETTVPDEVGSALLAEQEQNDKDEVKRFFVQHINIGDWTYKFEAPLHWKLVETNEKE